MKRAVAILMLAFALVSASGCESSTGYGPCIDAAKDDANPKLVYRLSTRNTVLGIIFVETIFTPIIVLVSETFCPVGTK